MMDRRTFLRWLGVVAAAPTVIAKAVEKSARPKFDAVNYYLGFRFVRTNLLVGVDPKIAFTNKLEAEGKLAFHEHIELMPTRAHCVQVTHTQNHLQRVHWVDADDDLDKMLPTIRENSRAALRRYWAQQIRWKRKAIKAAYYS